MELVRARRGPAAAVFALLGLVVAGPPASGEPAEPPAGVVHVVERGQTLWRIARTYEVEIGELARINGIADPTRIHTGQRVFVPGVDSLRVVVPPSASPVLAASAWAWPVEEGVLLSYFGAPRRSRDHQGVDIRARHGQPVVAARAGRVVYSGAGMRGYGKTVIIDHGDGISTLYAHNSALAVRVGQRVAQGERIARVGRSGNASSDHCHFEIRHQDRPVDPLPYLARSEARR
ncbi:MAG TPA: LysM peptidoglycan-binding domain-containing M23 family metallopeptidase [Candidatus Polarisedimenticolaceae bacterium]|nr:LysM peptidoglycan-binding domain-containing M23 family metallopeptidase [Candidatus Polarisedimenticolaceae bacterium]